MKLNKKIDLLVTLGDVGFKNTALSLPVAFLRQGLAVLRQNV